MAINREVKLREIATFRPKFSFKNNGDHFFFFYKSLMIADDNASTN